MTSGFRSPCLVNHGNGNADKAGSERDPAFSMSTYKMVTYYMSKQSMYYSLAKGARVASTAERLADQDLWITHDTT